MLQGWVLAPLLFLLYINDLTTVSTISLSVLLADDNNIFLSGKHLQSMSMALNEQLAAIYEWLCCKQNPTECAQDTSCDFTPWNKNVNNINFYMNKVLVEFMWPNVLMYSLTRSRNGKIMYSIPVRNYLRALLYSQNTKRIIEILINIFISYPRFPIFSL